MAAPNQVNNNVIYFNAAAQELLTIRFRIKAIVWTSNEGVNLDIAADDDMLLSDAAGNKIVGKRAEGAGDGLELALPGGLDVMGLIATTLDGGVLYVIGEAL